MADQSILGSRDHSRFIEYDRNDPQQVNWLSLPLTDRDSEGHFMAVGTTGSGKTTVLRLLMQSVLPSVGTGNHVRAIVYDAKEDMIPIISAFSDPKAIKTLNPFDARGVAWAIHKDITEPRLAVELAEIIIPESSETTRFFLDASRHIVTGVIVSFILSKIRWTIGDIIRAVNSPDRAKRVLLKHARSADYIGTYFDKAPVCSDIFTTISSKLTKIIPVVAAWESAQEQISLTDFYQEEWILVLGSSETSRATVQAINRLFFKRACDLLLAMPEYPVERSWFFLDELGDAGRLDGLPSLLKKGRSKGGRVALTFQTIGSLRNEPVYGTHVTDEILGQIGNRFIGLVECPETAEWASRLVGDIEFIQKNFSHTSGQQSSSTTSYNHVIVRSVLPSEFMSLPACSDEDGLTGFLSVRGIGWGVFHIHPHDLFHLMLIPINHQVPAFVPRPVECQYLRPWTKEEESLFTGDQQHTKLKSPGIPPSDVMQINLDDILDNNA